MLECYVNKNIAKLSCSITFNEHDLNCLSISPDRVHEHRLAAQLSILCRQEK